MKKFDRKSPAYAATAESQQDVADARRYVKNLNKMLGESDKTVRFRVAVSGSGSMKDIYVYKK